MLMPMLSYGANECGAGILDTPASTGVAGHTIRFRTRRDHRYLARLSTQTNYSSLQTQHAPRLLRTPEVREEQGVYKIKYSFGLPVGGGADRDETLSFTYFNIQYLYFIDVTITILTPGLIYLISYMFRRERRPTPRRCCSSSAAFRTTTIHVRRRSLHTSVQRMQQQQDDNTVRGSLSRGRLRSVPSCPLDGGGRTGVDGTAQQIHALARARPEPARRTPLLFGHVR